MDSRLLWLLLVCGLSNVSVGQSNPKGLARDRLMTDLLVNYDASVRPVADGKRLDVRVKIDLQHFDYHETDGSFHLVGLLVASWHDPKLTWDPKKYQNIEKVPMNHKFLWVPDLEVYNNVPAQFLRMHRNGFAVVEHTGRIQWSDNIEVTIFCTTSMLAWPHDEHECKMRLGSWTYHGYELGLLKDSLNDTLELESIDMTSMSYKMVNFSAEHVSIFYDCCDEPYVSIDYNMTFQRRSAFAAIFRTTGVSVMLLSSFALLMNPRSTGKLWLNAICVILLNFNIAYFANTIGRLARDTPLIVSFYSWSLVMVTFSHCVCVFSVMATRTRYCGKLPVWCSQFLQLPTVHCVSPPVKTRRQQRKSVSDPLDFGEESSNLITAEFYSNEWTQLALFMQRITFAFLVFIYVVLSSTCFV